jgi:hypothetical protein
MATYIRLTDYKSSDEKEQEFFNPENRYDEKQEEFKKVPRTPIVYWLNEKAKNIFSKCSNLSTVSTAAVGQNTGDNDRFLKYWYEVNEKQINKICKLREETYSDIYKWYPYNKGGGFRKWYGNFEYVINWHNDAEEIKKFAVIRNKGKHWSRYIQNLDWVFKKGLTWSDVTSGRLAGRYLPEGYISDVAGHSAFFGEISPLIGLSIINSKFIFNISKVLNPTMHFQVGNYRDLPYSENLNTSKTLSIINRLIEIAKIDWDSYETSLDFKGPPLLNVEYRKNTLRNTYLEFYKYSQYLIKEMQELEKENNSIFINAFELSDELPDVSIEDITLTSNMYYTYGIKKSENKLKELFLQDTIKQFISYGVGVMFGRYSLDREGLLIANMGQDIPANTTFEIDDDNIIPVLEDDFFSDDIASRFVQFVRASFGEENLSENIKFIEDALGSTIRKYFVKGFYEDHIKRYKKRPIYWMVSSPKKGFMSLIYMHRYRSDVFSTIQNDYLREYIEKLESNNENLQRIADDESNSNADRSNATREIVKSNKILDEIIQFDRNSLTRFAQDGIEIDLDDGVKVNYCKFKDILYPISGLCK